VKRPLALLSCVAACAAQAQNTAPEAPAAPAAAASAPQRVEIVGGRPSDTEERRRSTAAKIIVGRDEIEAFGDSTVGEVLRRLPGVTTPGRPGRGGAPRMRGLGSGYTQILIDGEPLPRGFQLDSLTPDQVERIEILRAPTAETGARAIAGTINIILREGYRKRLNDLRLGIGTDGGQVSPGLFWTHNDSADALTYNLSGAAFERRREDDSTVETRTEDAETGELLSSSRELRHGEDRRRGLNLTARLQWKLGEAGDQLMLTPSVFHADNQGSDRAVLTQTPEPPAYDLASTASRSRFTIARLNGQWRQRLSPAVRAELGGTASGWRSSRHSLRDEFLDGLLQRRIDDSGQTSENSLNLKGKLSFGLGGNDDTGAGEHSLVTGAELEAQRRNEQRTLLQDGLPLLADFGDNLKASSTRAAVYAQDEWNPTAQWSLHAGLRWEGITTEGDLGDGTRPRNRNSVWTPLAHAVWKPDPKSRSQLRMSLTRSWRAPSLGSLIARPSPNLRFPLDGPNEPTYPDRAGNPDLQPELATGVDLAFEHYPAGGGVLSASVFHRRIRNLMRSVTTLEVVPWSPVPRWVARTQNVGDATTQGVELEAKGRLEQWWAGAPRVELRANLSVFDSKVEGVPGPDNRLDQQPRATANLGGDYRIPGWPLKIGGNLNWVPAYETQTSETERVGVSTRRIADAYALWTLSPAAALRVQASNLAPLDSDDFDRITEGGVVQTTRTLSPSRLNWQLRLELKL
jgi:iron complex outermembrane receptor protein